MRLMHQLDHVFFPVGMAKDFLFPGPGGFSTSGLDGGMLCTIIIDIPHGFIGCTQCTTLESSLRRTRATTKRCANAKGINGSPGLQEFKNLPLVEIPTGYDAHILQIMRIQLCSDIEA